MKTYQEILNETIENDFRYELPTQTSPEERAAKEYAKQWVEYIAAKANTEMIRGGVMWIDSTSIRNVKNKIDTQ